MSVVVKSLKELAQHANVEFVGDPATVVSQVAPISKAQPGSLTFLDSSKLRKYLPETQASIVILSSADLSLCPCAALVSPNPSITYAKIAGLFDPAPKPQAGIHPTAVIGMNCTIPGSVSLSANCVIGNNVTLGNNVFIGPGCHIDNNVTIGDDCQIAANVVIYHDVKIANRVKIDSCAVIGSNGFGLANDKGKWLRVPQIGSVIIEDDVEIGASTAIDRAAIENTIICKGVKIDNLVQIGHNCKIGQNTAIAGLVAISGSVEIGANCMIGGACAIAGHLKIADGVILGGTSAVPNSIKEPGYYLGSPPTEARQWLKIVTRLRGIDDAFKRIKDLETKLEQLINREQV